MAARFAIKPSKIDVVEINKLSISSYCTMRIIENLIYIKTQLFPLKNEKNEE